jgi:hypothetical protein
MSDKPGIPSWQRASADSPTASSSESKQQAESSQHSAQSALPVVQAPTPTEDDLEDSSSETLLDQASRFLDDATIRDAPREKKVAFLASKGVTAEDIETLLGDSAQEDSHTELEEAGERAWLTVSNQDPAQQPCIPTWQESIREQTPDYHRHLQNQSNHHNRLHNLATYPQSLHIPSSSHKQRSHRLS